MFNFFKKPEPIGKVVTLRLSSLQCAACAINIDAILEEMPGVYHSDTNYAKSTVVIDYNPTELTKEKILKSLLAAGYESSLLE